jgi:hypothetical protein
MARNEAKPSERDPFATLAAVQGEIRALDPGLPADDIRTGTKVIDQALLGSEDRLGVFTSAWGSRRSALLYNLGEISIAS